MIMVNNPFGKSAFDMSEETSGARIGRRIRRIREARGLSQSQFGELVGLNSDRIQKYENGARKPRIELLKQMADALGVDVLALADPTTSSDISAMYALFELEDNFEMTITKDGQYVNLTAPANTGIGLHMKEWHKVYTQTLQKLELATTEEEKDQIVQAYNDWKWSYPQGVIDKTEKALMKAKIKDKIEELQEALDQLEEDE